MYVYMKRHEASTECVLFHSLHSDNLQMLLCVSINGCATWVLLYNSDGQGKGNNLKRSLQEFAQTGKRVWVSWW